MVTKNPVFGPDQSSGQAPRTSPTKSQNGLRSIIDMRSAFDEIYESSIVGGGFFETDDYYRNDKERYWRSLAFFCRLDLPIPARILEIGGGQLALLCKKLFGDHCTVGDISHRFSAPILKEDISFLTLNLMDPDSVSLDSQFDAIILLEVIEHLPIPAYVVLQKIKHYLKPDGVLFITTPNLFRARNLIRMFLGREFLDRFAMPAAGQGLGHQLEYSADHLRWQMERAGMEIVMLTHDSLGRTGHSVSARMARRLLAPLDLRPIWRDSLVAAARVSGHNRMVGAP